MRQATIGWDGRRRVIGAVASPLGDKTRGPVHLRRRPSKRGFSSGTPEARNLRVLDPFLGGRPSTGSDGPSAPRA
jgi:hypothetical protein